MSDYVPWDTGVLSIFLGFLKSAIGNAVMIGIVVFAAIMGILVVIKIIKIFVH